MDKELQDLLKEMYSPPKPKKKEAFLKSLPDFKKKHRCNLPQLFLQYRGAWTAAAATMCAVAVFGVGFYTLREARSGLQELSVIEPENSSFSESSTSEINEKTEEISSNFTSIQTNTTYTETSSSQQSQSETGTDTINLEQYAKSTVPNSAANNIKTTEAIIVSSIPTVKETNTTAKITTAPHKDNTSQTVTVKTTAYHENNPDQTVTKTTPPWDDSLVTLPAPESGIDLRVKPKTVYTQPSEDCLFVGKREPTSDSDSTNSVFQGIEHLADQSDLIVEATVIDVFYTNIQGMPWTQVDLFVDNVIQSNTSIPPQSYISIYYLGGYMPLRTYIHENDLSAEFDYMSESTIDQLYYSLEYPEIHLPQKGESALYFLKQSPDPVPESTYIFAQGVQHSLYYAETENFTDAKGQFSFSKDVFWNSILS